MLDLRNAVSEDDFIKLLPERESTVTGLAVDELGHQLPGFRGPGMPPSVFSALT
jgi:hypothetical protein